MHQGQGWNLPSRPSGFKFHGGVYGYYPAVFISSSGSNRCLIMHFIGGSQYYTFRSNNSAITLKASHWHCAISNFNPKSLPTMVLYILLHYFKSLHAVVILVRCGH